MTIHDRFAGTALRFPDHPYLYIPAEARRQYADGPLTLTYAQAAQKVDVLAAAWSAAGYAHGYKVALALDNRADFFLHFLALNRLGVCVVPLNSEATPAELAHVLNTSGASLLVTLSEHGARMGAAVDAAGRAVALCDIGSFPNLPPAPGPCRPDAPDGTTAAAIIFTSGTTSRPKGCLLSNDYFLYVGEWYAALGGHCTLGPGAERAITPLPVFHTNALVFSHMAMIETGGCVVQLDRFHPDTWWEVVRASRATLAHYLGIMPAILISLPEDPLRDRGHGLRFGFGAGVDPAHQAPFEERFGFPLIEGWAMTETGAATCVMAAREPRHVGTRCIGRPPGHMEYRIVDEAGRDVAAGEPGEFLVRRAGADPRRYFYSGYIGDPEATEIAWAGGWFHTGDVVREGADGSLHFIERRKNIIRRSGENIAAAEVESVLLCHPAVAACAVAPVPDEARGEEVAACVVAAPGANTGPVLARDIVRHCLATLSYYKVPGYVAFVPALPVTSTQKLQRGVLEDLLRRELVAGRAVDLREMKKRN
ncbi:MAG: AMP-binding protein [Gammaproteobacteria bacterium]|nr:AMP-binding protein [Gammaproteobacteria bacterium]